MTDRFSPRPARARPLTVARKLLPLGRRIGHGDEITDGEDNAVGAIESEFAVFDQYDLTSSARHSVPVRAIVIGRAVVDAIRGNYARITVVRRLL